MAEKMKKVSVRKVNLASLPVGEAIEGKFLGFTTSKPFNVVNEETGEITEKTLTNAIFEDDKAERFAVIADKGFQGAISDSMIKEGTWIKAVKLEKVKLGKGRTMNQYDLFAR